MVCFPSRNWKRRTCLILRLAYILATRHLYIQLARVIIRDTISKRQVLEFVTWSCNLISILFIFFFFCEEENCQGNNLEHFKNYVIQRNIYLICIRCFSPKIYFAV